MPCCTALACRFAYLSQPLLRDSANSIMQHWQKQAGASDPTAPPQQGRHLAWNADLDPNRGFAHSNLAQYAVTGNIGVRASAPLAQAGLGKSAQLGFDELSQRQLLHADASSAQLASGAVAAQDGSSSSSSAADKQQVSSMLGTLLARMQQVYPAALGGKRRHNRQAAADEGSQHFKLTEEHIEDDAFGTIMQVGVFVAPAVSVTVMKGSTHAWCLASTC